MTARMLVPTALFAALALTGCAHDNDRLTLGDRTSNESVTLDTITSGPGISPAAGPSISSTQRTDWEPVTILCPPERVDSCPSLTQLQPQYSSDRRHGNYPTADSALTLDDNRMAAAEFASAPLWAAWDIVLMIPRSIAAPLRTPDEHYERSAPPAQTPTPTAPAGS